MYFFRSAVNLVFLASLCLAFVSGSLAAQLGKSDENPWPAIRKSRMQVLLPQAMQRAGVDAWVVICRENNNDPLAMHVGGENAGGTAAFMFFTIGNTVHSIAISPPGEAVALRDIRLHDTVIVIAMGENLLQLVGQQLRSHNPRRIAVNSSPRAVADGLSYTQRLDLERGIGTDLAGRLESSDTLVTEWLSVKLPDEIEILRRAAELTAQLELEAYETVIPGVTRDIDVARFLKRRMRELGVDDSWAPDQNPNVNSGFDRGHSNATEKVIVPGDFIQLDFGIKVHGVWCTDVQRFAYVLSKGETTAPRDALQKWENARRGSRVALAAMKVGARGYDVDKAQRDWMKEAGSLPVMWGTGHPVGYWAHDVGPALSGAQSRRPPAGAALLKLRPGQTFAFDGFFSWETERAGVKGTKTISVEEMAVVTDKGGEYLIPPQEELVLIPSK